ncbi:hypothetical protein CONLIGDRAFT_216918 [Coniochaeta ligniaria NRRL 30616]|uniref:Cytochrome c oxidase-assembly factor COX23, mitochondrial n=1 Tax=Coniochaeta ligniaria NRRL 30616 TaxID=1408157 RepID=A0A1J7I4R0_9PEZI|nr:hypothetical protein CONLIGDRAFT_216918 [Coniochaeta ligniaria NRRL 30616]
MATAGDDEKGPWNKETKAKFESKDRSQWLDPCQAAAERSIRCLHRNGGDRALCTDYFQAYRDCKKEWLEKRRLERRKEGKFF